MSSFAQIVFNSKNQASKKEWLHSRGINYQFMSISDPIHTQIIVYPPLNKLIDTSEFQRLRRLKQLGLAHMVYPSADHTRFTHSLGVYHLALNHVNRLADYQSDLNITSIDKLCVCIAALVHDIGHGPLCHLYDNLLRYFSNKSTWNHEENSQKIFEYMLETNHELKTALDEYLTEKDYVFIMELLCMRQANAPEKLDKNTGKWALRGRDEEKSFLYDIISNKHDSIDIDKFDYFLRDAHYAGVDIPFGKVSMTRIMDYMQVKKSKADGFNRIVYAQKLFYFLFYVRPEIKTIVRSRKKLHKIVYQHKTIIGIGIMMSDALKKAAPYLKFQGKEQLYNLETAHLDIESFLKLDDTILDQIAEQIKKDILYKFKATHNNDGQRINCEVYVTVKRVHRGLGRAMLVDPFTKVLYFNAKLPNDKELEQFSKNSDKSGTAQVYVFIPKNANDNEYTKVFEAFKECTQLYNSRQPRRRKRRSILEIARSHAQTNSGS